ncbi:MAG: mandelate racemase/muconate lactonizing enzyme family protein [Actinomycetota bacterium]
MSRIVDVRASWLQAAVPPEKRHTSSFGLMDTFNTGLITIETEDGLIGFGEGKVHVGSGGNYAAMCAVVEHELAPLLVGEDARNISGLWQKMYNGARVPLAGAHGRSFPVLGRRGVTLSAISGVDVALWDLLGKSLSAPVYQLLGGRCRDRILAYASGGWGGVGEIAAEGVRYVEAGYRAIKIRAGLHDASLDVTVARVRELRDAVGPDVKVMIDGHGTFSVPEAKRLCRKLEPYDLAWFEEPTAIDDPDGMRQIRQATDIPIAAGESEQTRYPYRDLLAARAVDVVQPDLSICGGISEARHVASLASAYQLQLAPHVFGGAVIFAAGLHFAAATPNVSILEHCHGYNPLLRELAPEQVELRDGCFEFPAGPGLGVTPSPARVAEFRRDWRSEL